MLDFLNNANTDGFTLQMVKNAVVRVVIPTDRSDAFLFFSLSSITHTLSTLSLSNLRERELERVDERVSTQYVIRTDINTYSIHTTHIYIGINSYVLHTEKQNFLNEVEQWF